MKHRTLNPKVVEVMKTGTAKQRAYISAKRPEYFMVYYFPHFFTHPIADFHYIFYEDIPKLLTGELKDVAWVGFRESGKTSIAKMALVCWLIACKDVLEDVYGTSIQYIAWDSYDKSNAEAALFDIATELQTNRRLIADFGQMYTKRRKTQREEDEEGSRIRRINNFITENKVKVEAFTTGTSPRGRVWKNIRPQLTIFDDIENEIIKESWAITSKIIRHIDAFKAGRAADGRGLFLGNYLLEEGVIDHVMSSLRGRADAIVRNIPVVDANGNITWPGKYVMTDEEARKANKKKTTQKRKISLESKKRELGETVYAVEMMNEPGAEQDYYFDRERIKELMARAKDPKRIEAGFKYWAEFNAKHSYAAGSDHASGIGGDHSTFVMIDISTTPNRVVITFENNEIGHDVFAHAIHRPLSEFGSPILVPEENQGYACIAELVRPVEEGGCGFTNIYQRSAKNRTSGKPMQRFGFWMSHATKPDILTQFRSAVQDGDLEIFDIDLLRECYRFTNNDARQIRPEEGQTRHFDKLIAAALAWEGRHSARPLSGEDKKRYYNTVQERGKYDMV